MRPHQKVLHLVDAMFSGGGIPYTVWSLVRALRDYTAWQPVILAGQYPHLQPLTSFEADHTIERDILPIWQPFGGRLGMAVAYPPGFQWHLRRLAREVDVVHIHGLWTFATLAACPVLRAMRKPYILAPRGSLEPWALAYKGFKKRLVLALAERRNLNRATFLQATSDMEQMSLHELGLSAPIVNVPNGLNPDAQAYFRTALLNREHHRPDQPERVALFVSRLHPKKRALELVQWFAQVKAPDWQLVIIGGDDQAGYQQAIQRTIDSLGLQNRVRLLGHVQGDALWAAYAAADLFVLPTLSENFGNVIIEALSAGVPVITTKGAPWSELETEQCGWWVDLDMAAFKQAMHEAMNLPDATRRMMGRRGLELVQKKYTWQSIAQQLSVVYDRATRLA